MPKPGSKRLPPMSMVRGIAGAVAGTALAVLGASADARGQAGDFGAKPLTDVPGDPLRGRAIVADRRKGLCLLCHAGPALERMTGNLAPSLAGVGRRLSLPELRARLMDARRFNPDTIMPAYFKTEDHVRVAPAVAGRPILSAQEIEDVVAFLATLQD
jgi:L-cysteine S-thiosulfotransferase